MTMTEIPGRASAVIIGAGIVGNSLVHHLAQLGWRDLVLVDKGPMPNPGGSTGHASNFIFPIEYSKMMFELTADSTAQYKDLGVFTESGGIEVARTQERMSELRRREVPEGRYTLVFVGYAPSDGSPPDGVSEIELTYNWDQAEPYQIGTGFGHLAVGVPDVAATVAAMRAEGVKVTREPGPVKFGTTVIAFVEDPDGYKMELIERN